MDPVEIFRSYQRAACDERAFVLHAVGIASELVWNGRTWSLLVPPETASAAIDQLMRYERENPPRRRPVVEEPNHRLAWLGSATYVILMLLVGFLAGRYAYGADWYRAGALSAAAVQDGEFWRAVTALTLHVDVGHLLSNLGFGLFFGFLAGQLLGPGLAWFSVLLAAAAANLFNAWIQSSDYSSIGASTIVFATLGLLAAYSWRRRTGAGGRWPYRWAPLIAGIALLGFTGVGGERTDVLAHLTGFLAGVGGGSALSLLRRRPRASVQWTLAAAALAAIALAWITALQGR
jgi:membrane associated rhomboid family serine protease